MLDQPVKFSLCAVEEKNSNPPPKKRGQDLSDLVVIKIFVKPTRNIFPGMIFNNFSVPFSAPKYVDMI